MIAQYTKNIIEFTFSLGLFVNVLLFIPQALKIFKKKDAKEISLITFIGFLLIQLAVVLHGLLNKDTILVWGYLLSMVTCGAVVVLALYYKNNKKTLPSIDITDRKRKEEIGKD